MSKIPKTPKAADKDTIYIDIDDEITTIIDKLRHSSAKIVALVLPKRSAALQSIVNLKLLKRTAQQAKKNIVLITSDPNLLPMAGVAGLHVAKTLQSKPSIPDVPPAPEAAVTVDSDEVPEETSDAPIDPATPIGKLAGDADKDDTIEVDNATPAVAAKKTSKLPKIRIPNFDKFRVRLFLGIGIFLLLIVGWIFAAFVLPKATIEIKTDTSVLNTTLKPTAQVDAEELDIENQVIPLITKEIEKTEAQTAPATGQRNDGKKATGSLTLTNCINDGQTYTIPAGTAFSTDGQSFVTNSNVTLGKAIYSDEDCISDNPVIVENFGTSKTVGVTASAPGDSYNLSARSYQPPSAYSTSNGSILASGSDMTGGTSKITKVVSQSDIDGAKQAALDKLNESVPAEFSQMFTTDQVIAIKETFSAGKPKIEATPKVNEPASEVNVAVIVTYKQSGLKRDDLTKLVEEEAKKHIDASKQVVQNTGLDEATIKITSKTREELKLEITTVVVAGPQLDAEGIKREIAGKKKAETREIITSRPGIQDVQIRYSPFWVFSTPKKTGKIIIVFNQNDASNQ